MTRWEKPPLHMKCAKCSILLMRHMKRTYKDQLLCQLHYDIEVTKDEAELIRKKREDIIANKKRPTARSCILEGDETT